MLNARADASMIRHPNALAETVGRAERYLAADAAGIFVPGVTAVEEIGRLTADVGAPVNVVAGLVELVEPVVDAASSRSLGVARISVGGTLARAVLSLVEQAAREMTDPATFGFVLGAIPDAALRQRFRRSADEPGTGSAGPTSRPRFLVGLAVAEHPPGRVVGLHPEADPDERVDGHFRVAGGTRRFALS